MFIAMPGGTIGPLQRAAYQTVLSNVRESSQIAYLTDECGLIMVELSRTFVDSRAEGRNMVQALVAGCDDENTTPP
jgi:hypothetical protein